MKKTLFVHLLVAAIMIAGVFRLYSINSESMQRFNQNFIDLFFNMRGTKTASSDIVIVDVDERTLQTLGRWPWRRDKIARLVDNLNGYGVGIIGFDMVFAEADEGSPAKILEEMGDGYKRRHRD